MAIWSSSGEAKLNGAPVCGLYNLGATCYMSSIIQALRALPAVRKQVGRGGGLKEDSSRAHKLYEYLFGLKERERRPSSSSSAVSSASSRSSHGLVRTSSSQNTLTTSSSSHRGQRGEIQRSLLALMHRMNTTKFSYIYPKAMWKSIYAVDDYWTSDRQQDALEFFDFLLEQVTCMQRPFSGELERTYVCTKCDSSTKMVEPFRHLSLPLARRKAATNSLSLLEALSDHEANEFLMGDNLLSCDTCKTKTIGICQTRIQKHPRQLAIGLSRFSMNSDTGHYQKTDVGVEIPERLAFAPGGVTYELSSFVLHLGTSVSSGHYVAVVKQNGRWFAADDTKVTEVSHIDHVLTPGPNATAAWQNKDIYLLFYTQQTTAAVAGGRAS